MSMLSSSAASPSRLVRLKLNTIMEEVPEIPEETQRGRSRAHSLRGSAASSPAMSTSTISSYYQRSRGSREFDDLYDVSDQESDQDSIEIPQRSGSSQSKRGSWDGLRKNRYPSLVIPSPTEWPSIEKYKKEATITPMLSSGLTLSPEVLQMLDTKLPASSSPPSLDESLTSDQVANASTPSTPHEFRHPANIQQWRRLLAASIYSNEEIQVDLDAEDRLSSQHSSMLLSPEALNLLQQMSLEQIDNNDDDEITTSEMQELPVRSQSSINIEAEPMSAVSEYSISAISLPSPGGLFGTTVTQAEDWYSAAPALTSTASPSFSSVEEFYNSQCEESGSAFTTIHCPIVAEEAHESHSSSLLGTLNQDSEFASATPKDRTSDWLASQTAWLASLRKDITPSKAVEPSTPVRQIANAEPSTPESVIKRAVHFLDTEVAMEADRVATESDDKKGDSLFYHAFQRMSLSASPTDSFVHRHSRFDAIQAQRTSLQSGYVNSLLGNYRSTTVYRPAPSRPISSFPGKNVESNLDDEEKQYFAALEREREATEQVAPAMWAVEALRYLSGGSLFNSPVGKQLAAAPCPANVPLPEHVRVLDLGGQPQCDWAWHCARDFPNVKTYTTILETQPHNPNLHGPSNHRLVTVENFYTLPFPSNHFDAISARSLAMYLKTRKPVGAENDEYDLCLKECLRVLKPGGVLEFFLLDAELVSSIDAQDSSIPTAPPAPLASKLSVEFTFSLQRHGYDPCPTKSFLSRLRRNGFSNIKRAWMFLPLGGETEVLSSVPETPPPSSGASVFDQGIFGASKIEAVQGPVGCTKDASAVSGLVGGWMWESWVVKLAREMGKDGFGGLVGDVGGVVEEGRKAGGGFRVLRGWGVKPL